MQDCVTVIELFAGIGAFSKALTNLGVKHKILDAVEIDKYAVQSFNAVHGTNFEPQDICEWDKNIECDLRCILPIQYIEIPIGRLFRCCR